MSPDHAWWMPKTPFRQLGVGTVDGVADVYQVRELDKVVLGGLQVVRLAPLMSVMPSLYIPTDRLL